MAIYIVQAINSLDNVVEEITIDSSISNTVSTNDFTLLNDGETYSFVAKTPETSVYSVPYIITATNQTALFGSDQLAGDGDYQISASDGSALTGVTDAGTGTATGANYTLSAGGVISVATNGSMSAENGNTIDITSDQGSCTVTLDVRANALVVAPETGTTERAAAIAHCAATPATDWTIYLRPGVYGTTSSTVFAITDRMNGSVVHSNLDVASIISDPTSYTYNDTATITGGSITFTPESGSVEWRDRTQFNGASGLVLDSIDFVNGLLNTPSPVITGTISTLGDFVFKSGTSISIGEAQGAGIQINGARRVVMEDCEITGTNNAISDLDCIYLDLRRNRIWNYDNDAIQTRNEEISTLGEVTMYRAADSNIIADRGTGASHADSWQFSSTQNQLPIEIFAAKNIFGPGAQGLFAGDTGNTRAIICQNVTGSVVAGDWTYGASNEYTLKVRASEDIGGGQFRVIVTRGDLAVFNKGDFTIPFPADGDTLTNGANTMDALGDTKRPIIYGGVVADNWYYGEFGQGFGLNNFEGTAVNNSIIRHVNDTTSTVSDAFMSLSDNLVGAFSANNLGIQNSSTDAILSNNVDLDAQIATGAASYPTVFDLSDKTFSLNADGWIEPSILHTPYEPSLLRAYLEATFATSQNVGAGKTLDWTKPVLSNALSTSVDTTVGNGRLYWVVGVSGLTITPQQIASGDVGWLHGLPVVGSDSGFLDVTAVGTQTPGTAPTVGSGESVYWCHVAGAGGISAVSEAGTAYSETFVDNQGAAYLTISAADMPANSATVTLGFRIKTPTDLSGSQSLYRPSLSNALYLSGGALTMYWKDSAGTVAASSIGAGFPTLAPDTEYFIEVVGDLGSGGNGSVAVIVNGTTYSASMSANTGLFGNNDNTGFLATTIGGSIGDFEISELFFSTGAMASGTLYNGGVKANLATLAGHTPEVYFGAGMTAAQWNAAENQGSIADADITVNGTFAAAP